jgi:catechol 2,3-dioxygenase-like lactoylglutathione lyase family enzyme
MQPEQVIPILRVEDAGAAVTWYTAIGFELEHIHRFEPHLPAFATIARNEITLFLSEHTGDARPGTLIYLRVHDLDAIAATLELTIETSPWGRECETSDPDGNRLRLGTPSWW